MSQADNERFAPLFFGEARPEYSNCDCGRWPKHWHVGEQVFLDIHLPDFCDIRGPYFGPACEELIKADWRPSFDDGLFFWQWCDNFGNEEVVRDLNLGRCTMLALEAHERMKK